MIRTMKPVLLSLFLAVLSVGAHAESGDEAAVRAAHEALVKASKAGDRAVLEKLIADNVQYSHSSAKLETKAEAIAALAKTPVTFDIHSETIHVYGKTATIRAKLTSHSPTGDIPMTMLQVWVKNGNNWQLVERQTTRLPAQ